MDVMAVCVPLTEVMSWMSWLCVFPYGCVCSPNRGDVMDVMAVCVPLTEVMSWMSWLCVFP